MAQLPFTNNLVPALSRVLRTLMLGAICLTASTSFAQYSVSYSGGTCTYPDGTSHPYGVTNNGYGGGTPGGSCSGNITATFTWIGKTPPPAIAILEQDCSATSASATQAMPVTPGAANNALRDPTVFKQSTVQYGNTILYQDSNTSGVASDGNTIRHFRQIAGPGSSFQVTLNPIASWNESTSGGGEATVYYKAALGPVQISFIDTNGVYTGPGARAYMIGQNCRAEVTAPLATANWQWRIPAAAGAFNSYTISPDGTSSTLDPSVNLTSQILSTHFSGLTSTFDIDCACSLILPPDGVADNDLAPDPITTVAKWSEFVETNPSGTLPSGALMDVGSVALDLTQGLFAVEGLNSPITNTFCGAWSSMKLGTPKRMVAAGIVPGRWEFIQMANLPSRSYSSTNGSAYYLADNGLYGLDSAYPFPGEVSFGYQTDAPDFAEWTDTPKMPLANTTSDIISTEGFDLYCLYLPPGVNSMPVALFSEHWGWTGSVMFGANGWSGPFNASTGLAGYISWPNQPVWNRIVNFTQFIP